MGVRELNSGSAVRQYKENDESGCTAVARAVIVAAAVEMHKMNGSGIWIFPEF